MGSLERRCLKQCVGGRPLYDGEVGLFLVSSSQDNICESRLHAGNGIFHCKKNARLSFPGNQCIFLN